MEPIEPKEPVEPKEPEEPEAPMAPMAPQESNEPVEPKEANEQYDVGYRKPPAHSRFKKGVSGNPKGRPRKSRDIDDLVDRALDRKIILYERGKKIRISIREALPLIRLRKAVSGDRHELDWAFGHIHHRSKPDMFVVEPEDEQAFRNYILPPNPLQGGDDGPKNPCD